MEKVNESLKEEKLVYLLDSPKLKISEKVKLIDSVISDINTLLEVDWSMKEVQDGKVIGIKKNWAGVINYIIHEYRRNDFSVR